MIKGAQSLNPGKMVELIEIDLANAPDKPEGWTHVIRFTSAGRGFNQGVAYRGNQYAPGAFQVGSISQDSGGKIPEPTLKIQLAEEATGNIMNFLNRGGDPRGAVVKRIMIADHYLDDGASPNPNMAFVQKFFINQLSELFQHMVTFKLSATMGLDSLNDKVNRTLSSNQCNKKYRIWNVAKAGFDYVPVVDGGCEWGQAGEQSNFSYCPSWGTPYFDANDQPTTDPKQDRCSLSLVGCKNRFPITRDDQAFPISINLKG